MKPSCTNRNVIDKGGATVILDVEDYIKKANKKDKKYYNKISHDATQEHMKIVNDAIETFHCQQILPKNIADKLKTTNVKTPLFYITPLARS